MNLKIRCLADIKESWRDKYETCNVNGQAAGQIRGMAIARRVGYGMKIIVGDKKL